MILVEAPGLFTTVQDLGRMGFGSIGVSPSGAADSLALRAGNRLLGNREGAAALEMTLAGGIFFFPNGAVAALAGSDFNATLDDAAVFPWQAFHIRPGGRLRTGHTRSGARCYLCVRGGIEVEPFLGSASTHVLSGLGGFQGRRLKNGDILSIANCQKTEPKPHLALPDVLMPRKTLRVTDAPQSGWFSEAARSIFYGSGYTVTEEANRMGLRLEGPAIPAPGGGQMITEGVALGAVQIPSGGKPIILFVEQQTTGGYPKIANVISADMSSVGQLRPRDEIRFERVDQSTARALLGEQEEAIRAIH